LLKILPFVALRNCADEVLRFVVSFDRSVEDRLVTPGGRQTVRGRLFHTYGVSYACSVNVPAPPKEWTAR
jgi:hypothetical protein